MFTRDSKTRSVPVGSTSGERNNRRHLLQQAQPVDPAPVVLARRPGKLHDPAELIAYSVGESLYPVGRRASLNLKILVDFKPIITKGKPGFGRGPKHSSGTSTATNSVTKYLTNREQHQAAGSQRGIRWAAFRTNRKKRRAHSITLLARNMTDDLSRMNGEQFGSTCNSRPARTWWVERREDSQTFRHNLSGGRWAQPKGRPLVGAVTTAVRLRRNISLRPEHRRQRPLRDGELGNSSPVRQRQHVRNAGSASACASPTNPSALSSSFAPEKGT